MIGYVTLGTNDLERGATFYDGRAQELGVGRMMETERFIAWGEPGGADLGLTKPYDGDAATVGNGVMVAPGARDRAQVNHLHRLALDLGGSDAGASGAGGGYYVAYFRDLDGNKLNAFVMDGDAG